MTLDLAQERLRRPRTPENGESAPQSPPHDLSAERAVVGSVLLGGTDALVLIADRLRPGDFFRESHGRMYDASLRLLAQNKPVDTITLAAELERGGVLEMVGGRATLALMQEEVPTWRDVEHYAAIVKEKAKLRRLLRVTDEVRGAIMRGTPAQEVVESAQQGIFSVEVHDAREARSMYELLSSRLERLEKQQAKEEPVGLATGFADVDAMIGGMEPGDLIVVGGRPGMGKTSWALQVGLNVALAGHGVLFFSLEMSADQLIERLLAMVAKVDGTRIHRGRLSDREYAAIVKAMGPLEKAPIHINDQPSLDPVQMLAAARRTMLRQKVELVVIDYLGLMSTPPGVGGRDTNRTQIVDMISRSMKAMARELGVPVIVLCQLKREVESRESKRPTLADLRESGQIEADADVAILMHRPDAYKPTEKPVAVIDIAKQRRGPTGPVNLLFRKALTRFENISKEEQQQ